MALQGRSASAAGAVLAGRAGEMLNVAIEGGVEDMDTADYGTK